MKTSLIYTPFERFCCKLLAYEKFTYAGSVVSISIFSGADSFIDRKKFKDAMYSQRPVFSSPSRKLVRCFDE